MQLHLLDRASERLDASLSGVRRRTLSGASWVDYQPNWVASQGQLFERLRAGLRWRHHQRWMYERRIDVPRLSAHPPESGQFPVVEEMARALGAHYRASFASVSFALYRDGRDGVAWHRDLELRHLSEAMVAIVSLGEPRTFMLRPYGSAGRGVSYSFGWGDLLVMGGACQHEWEHCIPKVRHAAPRMAVMFREPRWAAEMLPGLARDELARPHEPVASQH